MSLFIIQNSRGEFLDKSLEWILTADARALFSTPHKDVALNQLVELTTRDFTLRANVITCPVDDQGRLRLKPDTDRTAAA